MSPSFPVFSLSLSLFDDIYMRNPNPHRSFFIEFKTHYEYVDIFALKKK